MLCMVHYTFLRIYIYVIRMAGEENEIESKMIINYSHN